MNTGRIIAIGFEDKSINGFGTIDPNKKVKRFDEQLAGQLSGNPNYVTYMPGALGYLLNGGKGSTQAATQV